MAREQTRKARRAPVKFTLTYRQQDALGVLLAEEYHRIDSMPTDEAQGFTLGAKIASLVDVIELGKAIGIDLVRRSSTATTKQEETTSE